MSRSLKPVRPARNHRRRLKRSSKKKSWIAEKNSRSIVLGVVQVFSAESNLQAEPADEPELVSPTPVAGDQGWET
jgi:hypothetical protein